MSFSSEVKEELVKKFIVNLVNEIKGIARLRNLLRLWECLAM